MQPIIVVNTQELEAFSDRIGGLSRTTFPKIAKETINKVALVMKKDTLLKSAADTFVSRDKNFIKQTSRVDFAKGTNINDLSATVGFLSQTSKKTKQSVQNLMQQEHGGVIGGRKYIPVNSARTGKSNRKGVSKSNTLREIGIRNIVKQSNARGANNKQKFVKSVIFAGAGGFVQGELSNGVKMIWRVNSLNRTKRGKFKLTALYIVNDSKQIQVEKTDFSKKAAIKAVKFANDIFKKEVEERVNRQLRR